jgi:hypothetical protein
MIVNILDEPSQNTWREAAAVSLPDDSGTFDLVTSRLSRAQGMAGMLSGAAYASAMQPGHFPLNAEEIAHTVDAIKDEISTALKLLYCLHDEAVAAQRKTKPKG